MSIHRSAIILSALLVSACASAGSPTPQPAPVRERVTPTPPPTTPPAPAAAAVHEAAPDWHLLDPSTDRVPGIGLRRAQRELLAGKEPKRTVLVAVIDGGVDTAHAELRSALWKNAKEIPGNGRDDDGNGLVDDVYGWNFIGGPDGRNVHWDTWEVTRLYAQCRTNAPAAATLPCDSITKNYQEEKAEAERVLGRVERVGPALSGAIRVLKQAMRTDSLTLEKVRAFQPSSPMEREAKDIYVQITSAGITEKDVEEAREELQAQLRYKLDPDFDPRPIVGDNPNDLAQRRYGNRDVMGPDAGHGTHVTGIIAAAHDNMGAEGVFPTARIMTVRTIPEGDERDKDVASAVRYAVDNGAQIINMSFGKAWSPNKAVVDAAMAYADARGVLLVHAAGNDGEDLATHPSYPTALMNDGKRVNNWIEVGASSWKGGDTLAASFSNYGRGQVDVFAPGDDILSTIPGGGTEKQSGTSMAAPVVTGVAALLMAYYPDLTAADVKRVILESATRLPGRLTVLPGSDDDRKVPFDSLSATGGIVNVFAALQLAERLAAARQ